MKIKAFTLEGPVKVNPWGNWSDVDKGLYIGTDRLDNAFYDYEGKKLRITVEVLEEEMLIIELSNDLAPFPAKTPILVKESEIVE
jgi:hypothetical protein